MTTAAASAGVPRKATRIERRLRVRRFAAPADPSGVPSRPPPDGSAVHGLLGAITVAPRAGENTDPLEASADPCARLRSVNIAESWRALVDTGARPPRVARRLRFRSRLP